MTLREFFKYHLFKVLLGFVILQLAVVAIVQNFNHRPMAQKDQADMIEGNTSKISPLINDSDKDSDNELSIADFTDPLNGKVVKEGNVFFYTPGPDYVGLDSFMYSISDGKKKSFAAHIVINVHKNQVPVAHKDSLYLFAGMSMNLDILANDTDEENDSLFITDFTQARTGAVSLADNKLRFTAGLTAGITDAFTYSVSDGKNTSEPASVEIEILSKHDARYPWLSSDLGNAAIPGSFVANAKKYTLVASGSDIWDNVDGFRFVYQIVSGDFDLQAKVESMEASHEWAKAGLMARESLDGGSKNAFIGQSNRNGVNYHQRMEPYQSTQGGQGNSEIEAPCWVRLKRKADNFTYLYAKDGKSWTELGTVEIPLSQDIYLGMAVTSHDNDTIAKAVFSEVQLNR